MQYQKTGFPTKAPTVDVNAHSNRTKPPAGKGERTPLECKYSDMFFIPEGNFLGLATTLPWSLNLLDQASAQMTTSGIYEFLSLSQNGRGEGGGGGQHCNCHGDTN